MRALFLISLFLLVAVLISCGDLNRISHETDDYYRDVEIKRLEQELAESKAKECPEVILDEVEEIDQ